MRSREAGPTLKDVAALAGVHPTTASRALDPAKSHLVSEETRHRILRISAELGYQVNAMARSLRTGSSGLIGMVVADVSNPFLPPILRAIEQVIRHEGLMLLIAETHDDARTMQEILGHFARRRVDAIILTAAHQGDLELVRAAAASTPVVLAVRSVDGGNFPTVTHDDRLGGRLAAQHLVELGHQDVAQLRGPEDVSSFSGRSAGFYSVLSETTAREVGSGLVAASPTVEEGRRLTAELLAAGGRRPTAIFAHNDQMAVGAMDALREAGLSCPRDISIVGYNDAPLADHIDPPLTTIRLPASELGRRVARLALEQLSEDPPEASMVRLPPQLVIRRSTAPFTP